MQHQKPAAFMNILAFMTFVMVSALILFPHSTLAAGSAYVVEDADLVDHKSCEAELWHSRANKNNRHSVLTTSCNPFGGFEIGGEIAIEREDGERANNVVINGKTILWDDDVQNIALGLFGGAAYETRNGRLAEIFAIVPVSIDATDSLALNLNLGWLWDREERDHELTWGAGFDWTVIAGYDGLPETALITEIFGQTGGDRVGFQSGLRPSVIEDKMHLDLIYGRNITGSRNHWFTIGTGITF